MQLKVKGRFGKVSEEKIADFAFIMYFANAMLRTFFRWLFGGESSIAIIVAVVIAYVPVLLLYVLRPKKYIKWDVIALYAWLAFFIGITVILHPEYNYYYARPIYGLWDYVIIPYRGIYAYLFVRLINNPQKIMRNMEKTGWIMFIYFAYQIINFLRRGYWYGVDGLDGMAKLSYSVSFGYEVLPFALTFLYLALKRRKYRDIFASGLSIVMILVGGSRGPILFLGLFIVLYVCIELKYSRKKIVIISCISIVTILLYTVYEPILMKLSVIITKMGFSSRFITTLLNGAISNDSGRSAIWQAAIEMIKDSPFGYGAMGTRPVITKIIAAGYPHSVILEILVDYGVFVGGALLVFFFISSLFIMFSDKSKMWSGIFLVFFCSTCSLFISLTYWSVPTFWGCLGIGVNCFKYNRLKKGKNSAIKCK